MRQSRKINQNLTSYEIAQNKVECIKKFYISLFIYAIVLLLFLVKEYGNVNFKFFPINFINWFIISIWTFIMIVKAIKLFVKDAIFGANWEQRKVQEFMEKENHKTQSWQ